MPKHEEHIGDRLLEAIKAKGVAQADVARHFKVAAATVSSDWIKHGRIAKKHISGLVEYFGKPYEYWLGSDGSDFPGTTPAGAELTKEQQQILSLMGSLDKDVRDALLKIAGLLPKHQRLAKPQQDQGVTDEVKSVKFAPLQHIKTESYEGPNRRKANTGHSPERRLDSNTYSDEHDLLDYANNDNREEQIQKRGEIDD